MNTCCTIIKIKSLYTQIRSDQIMANLSIRQTLEEKINVLHNGHQGVSRKKAILVVIKLHHTFPNHSIYCAMANTYLYVFENTTSIQYFQVSPRCSYHSQRFSAERKRHVSSGGGVLFTGESSPGSGGNTGLLSGVLHLYRRTSRDEEKAAPVVQHEGQEGAHKYGGVLSQTCSSNRLFVASNDRYPVMKFSTSLRRVQRYLLILKQRVCGMY